MIRLPVLFFALVVAAGASLTWSVGPGTTDRQAKEFHGLVGGLGFGPALDLESCEFSFDPRLCPDCICASGHVPGTASFCPYHASALIDYDSPNPSRELGEADGALP
jgi:hypothetical protein